MKALTLITALFLLASCNDALRTRIGKCRSNNKAVICNEANALKSDQVRRVYIATITVPVSVGQTQFIIKEHASNSDWDGEMSCDLEVSANKKFAYTIENGKLLLKEGLTTLRFNRNSGLNTDGLVGTWLMQEVVGNLTTVTELSFIDLDEMRITKTCKLK